MLTAAVTLQLTGNDKHDALVVIAAMDGVSQDEVRKRKANDVLPRVQECADALAERADIQATANGWECGGVTARQATFGDLLDDEPDGAKASINLIQAVAGKARQEVLDMPYPVYMALLEAVNEDALQGTSFRGAEDDSKRGGKAGG